ncbi:hypothetical protein E8E12_004396 [Didymella heteroderae]|uniref:Peptidase A1 domain-containing protein n=1 Tax=Didymella heteroderae TaxID=1769908 RepID=A0A9P4WTQ1_9PLEO|nr:hypothetical protein E8E12_004396 [Didymella heteroderae]
MRSKHSAYLLLLSIESAYAAQCATPPLVLPIRTASVGPGILSRGMPISLGTPPQHLVLTPSLQLDTPFVPRYTNSCVYAADTPVPANDTRWTGQDGRYVCLGIYGGAIVPELSATFSDNSTNSPVSEVWFKKTRFWDWRFMTDSFIFTDYVEAYAQLNGVLPEKRNVTTSFILPNEGAGFGGMGVSALSLTPGSRMLETLVAEGVVPTSMGNQQLSTEDGTWGAYGQDVPVLGQPFTDSIVLRWDEATQEYGLANRNPKSDAKKSLKPLGCDSFPSVKKSVGTTPNVGIIVGSTIGGLVTGLLFAAAAMFFYFRGQRGVQSKPIQTQ